MRTTQRPRSGRLRSGTVTLMIAALLVAVAVPAWAWVDKHGEKDCGTNNVAVRSYSQGQTIHEAPIDTQIGNYPGTGDWEYRTTATSYTDTSWKVEAAVALNSPETYAFCWGTR